MLAQRARMAGHRVLVGVRQVDPHRDAHHIEAEDVRVVRDLDVLAVVGEVDHRGEVEILACVVVDLREDRIRVEDAVRVRRHRDHARRAVLRGKAVERLRVTVVVVDMAAHDVQHDEVVLRGVYLREVGEEGLVVLVREIVGVVRPLRVVGRLCDERDGAVVLPVSALVAEPPRLVARLLRDVDERCRVEEFLAVVLALLRERALENGDGLRPARIDILKEEEMVVCAHGALPGRVVVGVGRRVHLHIVA